MRDKAWLGLAVGVLAVACRDPEVTPVGEGSAEGGSTGESIVSATSTSGAGETGSTEVGESSSSDDGPPDVPEECMVQDWAVTLETPGLSAAVAIVPVDGGLMVLERRSGEGAHLHRLSSTGQPMLGPIFVADAYDADMGPAPDGVVVVGLEPAGGSLSWWSTDGDALGQIPLMSAEDPLWPTTLLVLEDGSLLVGGGADQGILQHRSETGELLWEHITERRGVLDLAQASNGDLLALTANEFPEGYESDLEVLMPDGSLRWSRLAGSQIGNGNRNLAPYRVIDDGMDGAVLLASDVLERDPSTHAARVEHHDEEGVIWTSQAPLLNPEDSDLPGGGGIAWLGDRLVVVAGRGRTTLALLDASGAVECRQWVGEAPMEHQAETILVDPEGGLLIAGWIEAPGGQRQPWVTHWSLP